MRGFRGKTKKSGPQILRAGAVMFREWLLLLRHVDLKIYYAVLTGVHAQDDAVHAFEVLLELIQLERDVAVVVAVRRGSQETDFARDRRDADGLFVLGVLPGEGDVGRLAVGESLGVVLVGAVRVFGDPAAGVDVEVVPAPVFGVVGVCLLYTSPSPRDTR